MERLYGLLRAQDLDGALALCDGLNEAARHETDTCILHASVLMSAGLTEKARVLVDGVIKREPRSTEGLYIKSRLEFIAGRDNERRALLESILKIDGAHIRALCDLGEAALNRNAIKDAGKFYDRALAAAPDYEDALVGRAGVYRHENKPNDAQELLNRAVSLYPDSIAPLTLRSRLYRDHGFFKNALDDLDMAKQLDGLNYWVAYDRGSVLVKLNRKAEALDEFARAITMNPDVFAAYAFSAGIKDEAGDYEGAERDYEAIINLNPDYFYAYEGLGLLKMRKKDPAAARYAFYKAWEREPDDFSYAALTALNYLASAKNRAEVKPFLEEALRHFKRESINYALLRLFLDYSGDGDVARKIEEESDPHTKAQSYFYMGKYYEVRGNDRLAAVYYQKCKETGRKDFLEWRLNEWALDSGASAITKK
jgi:tetratricopeptide (TPR) repeat protein